MSASTYIALGSLLLAAVTVILSYLNVRHQTDAARQLERAKWLREKQHEIYAELSGIQAQAVSPPKHADPFWSSFDSCLQRADLYASDAVLEILDILRMSMRAALPGETLQKSASRNELYEQLVYQIRAEIVGPEGRRSDPGTAQASSAARLGMAVAGGQAGFHEPRE